MSTAPKHGWPSRLRFRLSTILLLMTIIALGVAQFVSTRRVVEIEALNRELIAVNAKLRAEAGLLEIDDPKKAAVLRLFDSGELTWRWKVWLPPGKWELNVLTQGVPSQGVRNGSSVGIDGGREFLATAVVRKGADGKWQFRAMLDSTEIGNELPESHRLVKPSAPGELRGSTSNVAGDKSQESFDADQPVVLIRLRAHEAVQLPNGTWQTKDDPSKLCDGIMVWLLRGP